jgi:hypothetical protein
MVRGLLMSGGVPANIAAAAVPLVESLEDKVEATVKRKVSAYERRYKAAFKRVSARYKTKAGKWLKNGFKRAVKAAHKEAKR